MIHQEFLVELISRGVEINLPASSGSTALHFAATNNRKGIIEVLLLSGADPSIPNESGHLASELTSDKDIKMLLSREPSQVMNTKSSRYAISAINQARQSLKAHVESYQNDNQLDASNLGFEKLAIADPASAVNSATITISGQVQTSIPTPMAESSLQPSNLLQSVPTVGLGLSNNYIENDSDEAEEREELKQAVFKAVTDTATATQNMEDSGARRSVAEICQSTKYFQRNEPTLRKVSSFYLNHNTLTDFTSHVTNISEKLIYHIYCLKVFHLYLLLLKLLLLVFIMTLITLIFIFLLFSSLFLSFHFIVVRVRSLLGVLSCRKIRKSSPRRLHTITCGCEI